MISDPLTIGVAVAIPSAFLLIAMLMCIAYAVATFGSRHLVTSAVQHSQTVHSESSHTPLQKTLTQVSEEVLFYGMGAPLRLKLQITRSPSYLKAMEEDALPL